jgi:gamma-D-glutamyl-L-lysine dipeptidyl-peptidase
MLSSLVSAATVSANVARPVANMYSKPSMDADVVSQTIYGTGVGILEEKPGWARVRTPDEYTGWMEEGALRKLGEGEPGYAASGRVARVVSLFANAYHEPDVTRHAPLLTVPFETRLVVEAEPKEDGARWIQVLLVDRRTAWIQRGDVGFDDAPLSVAALAGFSKRFLGLPYLWGGTSTFGFDCSGFVQMLYRRIGVMLPRDAQPQADWSGLVPVERANLRSGDLLYFGQSPNKITHTGMYIGAGEFIDATTHDHPAVQIDKLGDAYWTKLLVAARRLK